MIHVIAKCRYVGFHRWPEAPKPLHYLALRHRHEFHVKAVVGVRFASRQIEFHTLKGQILDALGRIGPEFGERTCESIALHVANHIRQHNAEAALDITVEVLEDGECGGAFSLS